MAVSQVGSTTTSYYVTNGANGASASSKTVTSSSTTVSSTTTRSGSASTTSSATSVSSTTAVSRTTKASGSASTTSSTTAISSTTSYASATAKTTCSTTVTYSGSSSTAKVSSTTVATVEATSTNKVGSSASTTASATASVTNKETSIISSETPIYAYLSHMGGEALELFENNLDKYGYNKGTTFTDSLTEFMSAIRIDDKDMYSYEATAKAVNIFESLNKNQNIMERLYELGFVNIQSDIEIDRGNLQTIPYEVAPYSVNAEAAPRGIIKALENFCYVYNVEYDLNSLEKIMEKVDEVYNYYKDVLESENVEKIYYDLKLTTNKQKENFCKTWTFLKMGMGFSNELSSAVLANCYKEGVFSETNRQDTKYDVKLDDSQTYEYKSNDEKGFGIMQWTYQPRKENLIRLAYEMGSGVGNINVQFATFKDEITKVDLVKGAWSSVLKENDLESYTRTFMLEVENPEDKSENKQKERVDAARIIYNGMEG